MNLFRGLAFGGMDYHLAMLTDADAFGADARHIFQRQMDDAAFARSHRVEAKRLLGGLHALGGDFGGHAQLFKAQRAISAAIDVNFFVKLRLEAQSTKRKMFQGLEYFGAALEQDFFVAPVDIGEHFRIIAAARLNHLYADLQLQSRGAQDFFEKIAKRVGSCLAVELPVLNQFLSHGALNKSIKLRWHVVARKLIVSCSCRFYPSPVLPVQAADACDSATTAEPRRPDRW